MGGAALGALVTDRPRPIVPGDLVRIGGSELEWEAQPWEDA